MAATISALLSRSISHRNRLPALSIPLGVSTSSRLSVYISVFLFFSRILQKVVDHLPWSLGEFYLVSVW